MPSRVVIGLLVTTSTVVSVACTPLRPIDDDGHDATMDALDAGSRDVGPSLDAARDAPVTPDATFDAPGLDAPPPDAWSPDAWAPDAFTPADAYVVPDAWVSPRPIMPRTPGSVVISEIMIQPSRGPRDEWIEIYNPSAAQAYDLRGCSLDGMATSNPITGSFEIDPRTYGTAAAGPDAGFGPDYVYSEFLLEDTSDRAALVCDGVVIDEVRYDRTFPLLSSRSIMVSSSVLGGVSPHLANDVAAAWCSAPETARYSTRDYGTPGAINVCPP